MAICMLTSYSTRCIIEAWQLLKDFIVNQSKVKDKPGFGTLDGSIMEGMDLTATGK
jgi:hypothetical protein